ncbi:hypothetical protein J6590_039041, partial [Homalodisca vitripennis]
SAGRAHVTSGAHLIAGLAEVVVCDLAARPTMCPPHPLQLFHSSLSNDLYY